MMSSNVEMNKKQVRKKGGRYPYLPRLKKIGFCITCMNRRHHIEKTLEQNILDNFYPDDVEFVLLDYNSSDGLEEWAKSMQNFIDAGILVYYRTPTPSWYKRGHSRNMAIRLSDAEIVCNLDADNFLGKDFCQYIIQSMDKNKNTFYTSNYSVRNIVGRVCVSKLYFEQVRGYNEQFDSYGFEDVEFYDRLKKAGLTQKYIEGSPFYQYVDHSNEERILCDPAARNLENIYLAYLEPYRTLFLLLYNDHRYKTGVLLNNCLLYYNVLLRERVDLNDWLVDRRSRVVFEDEVKEGEWRKTEKSICLDHTRDLFFQNSRKSLLSDTATTFYELNNELFPGFIMMIGEAINYRQSHLAEGQIINPSGFGKGIVYKNFDNNKKIILK